MQLLISSHDIRHGPLELLCRRALTHDAAECSISWHFGIAPAPGHAPFRVEPDQPLGPLRNAAKDVGARIEVVGTRVAENDHRRLRGYRPDPLLLEIHQRTAVVGRAESDLRHDLAHGLFGRPGIEDVADLDEMAGEGERAHVVDHLMQAVDQQQKEVGHLRHRSRDIADRHDLRPVAVAALPRGEEWDATPGGVAPKRPPDVEMPAALALAGLAVTLAQPSRDGADQGLHLLDLPALEARERRVAQDFMAEV